MVSASTPKRVRPMKISMEKLNSWACPAVGECQPAFRIDPKTKLYTASIMSGTSATQIIPNNDPRKRASVSRCASLQMRVLWRHMTRNVSIMGSALYFQWGASIAQQSAPVKTGNGVEFGRLSSSHASSQPRMLRQMHAHADLPLHLSKSSLLATEPFALAGSGPLALAPSKDSRDGVIEH